MVTLQPGTFPAFAFNYIKLVDADNPTHAVNKYADSILSFFQGIPAGKIDYRYAEGKWTIKEMLQHLIDAERVFSYRALCLARHDKTPLPGFDENDYAAASNAASRSWESLLEEFTVVRRSTDLLIASFTEEQWQQTGITNQSPNSVLAIVFTAYGHILHHINILKSVTSNPANKYHSSRKQ